MLSFSGKNIKPFTFAISIAVIALLITFLGENTSDVLQYDSQAIAEGEIWRLVTAHVVHLGWSHLWLNLAGLLLVFVFFADCLKLRFWIFAFAVNALLISLLVYFLNPEIRWYVGLSGVLHGLFVVGGIADIRVRKWEGISFTLIVLAKVIYEQIAGPLPGSEEAAGGPVLVDAHFYGAMIGLIMAIPLLRKKAF